MEKVYLTCPFTGVNFQGFKHNGKIMFNHPLLHEMCSATIDNGKIIIPANLFAHIETVTPNEAADILCVSRQRISQLINDDVIPSHMVNGQPVFIETELLEYKENRKAGRPRKDANNR